jgi:protein-disulfide isomerase
VPVVDIYEDPLCPACKALEDRIAPRLAPALTGGRITVRYHIINFLDPMSKPPGYPLTAANAMLCAAQDGIFRDYHASLYAAQPHEDSPGYSINALVGLGAQLGAPPDFTACVRGGRYERAVRAQLQAFLTNPTMLTALPSGLPALGTPGVLVDGRRVDDPATTLPQLITH